MSKLPIYSTLSLSIFVYISLLFNNNDTYEVREGIEKKIDFWAGDITLGLKVIAAKFIASEPK